MAEMSSGKTEMSMSASTWNEADEDERLKLEAASMLRKIVGRVEIGGGNVQQAWRLAARATGFSFGRVKRLWYREALPKGSEIEQLRRVIQDRIGAMNDLGQQSAIIERRMEQVEAKLDEMLAERALRLADAQSQSSRRRG